MEDKKKIIYVTPHLSTGGMPEVLRKRVEVMKDIFDVYVVEFTYYGDDNVIQRNKIINLIGKDRLITLGGLTDGDNYLRNRMKLIDWIEVIKPDIVHMEEVPEMYFYGGFPDELGEKLYSNDRDYVIFETSHDAGFDPDKKKKWIPDKFLFISDWHLEMYKNFDVPKEIIEYPVEKKIRPDRDKGLEDLGLDPSYTHILNVGLFSGRKNQGEIFEIAQKMSDEKIQFHFIGNQAENFGDYWQPLMDNKPDNCRVWGERGDVDSFYSCMDLFLFTSKGWKEDRETNPIVLKEAMSWQMPILMYDLEVYCGKYNNVDKVDFLCGDIEEDVRKIEKMLYPKKAFITHATEQYLPTVECLIESICEFSKYPIILYTINCDANFDYPNLRKIRYDTDFTGEPKMLTDHKGDKFVERKDDNTFYTLTMKPEIIVHALSKGLVEGVYIDGDMIANHNVDDLFDYNSIIDNYPLVTEGVFEVMSVDGQFCLEDPLMKIMDVHERMWYRQTNTILFNKDCTDFIKEWGRWCRNEDLLKDWRNLAPYHEETIINVLFWKYGYDKYLPQTFLNTVNRDTIQYFIDCDLKYNTTMRGTPIDMHGEDSKWWLRIPEKKEYIKLFHGMKNPKIMKESIDYIKLRSKKNIAIIQTHDLGYSQMGDISHRNIKKYADKHGYSVFRSIQEAYSGRTPHWNKILEIKKYLPLYDWVVYIDSDILIMNDSIKIEEIIDDDYEFIVCKNKYCCDIDALDGTITSSFMIVKGTETMEKMMQDAWDANRYESQKVSYQIFDHEQRQIRILINENEDYRSKTKIVEEKVLNSVWRISDPEILKLYPDWNTADNIYKPGDFVIHFVGYKYKDRGKIMEQFEKGIIEGNPADKCEEQIHSIEHVGQFLNDKGLIGNGVEIGVLRGDYSKILLSTWKGHLFMVDSWYHREDGYVDSNNVDNGKHISNMNEAAKSIMMFGDNASMMKMSSSLAASLFPDEYFDYIYIDADHRYDAVKKDIKEWFPKLKKGGLFMGDDYIPEEKDAHIWTTYDDGSPSIYAGIFGVKQAVDEFAESNGYKVLTTQLEQYWKQWYFIK